MNPRRRMNRDYNHITDAAWTAKDIAACIACYLAVAAFPAMLIAAAFIRGWRL